MNFRIIHLHFWIFGWVKTLFQFVSVFFFLEMFTHAGHSIPIEKFDKLSARLLFSFNLCKAFDPELKLGSVILFPPHQLES